MTAAQQYWWLAPVVSGAALIAVLWFQWGQHKVRAWRMKRPFDAYLTIVQEKHDSSTLELYVPPNSQVQIQVRIYPRLHYRQMELIFGFESVQRDKRPEILKTINTFIAHGKTREQSPDDNEKHYVDIHGNYHIKDTVERTKPNCYVIGYLVKTKQPGRYPVILQAMTDSGEGLSSKPLFLIVENRSTV